MFFPCAFLCFLKNMTIDKLICWKKGLIYIPAKSHKHSKDSAAKSRNPADKC